MIKIYLDFTSNFFILFNEKMKVYTDPIRYKKTYPETLEINYRNIFQNKHFLHPVSRDSNYDRYDLNQIIKLPKTDDKKLLKVKYLLAPYFTHCYLSDTEPMKFFTLNIKKKYNES